MKILIDAAFDCYRAHYAFGRFSNAAGHKTGVLFGFLRAINSYRKLFKGEVIVAWEGRPKSRHAASSDYKSDRAGLPDDVVSQLTHLREILRAMGVMQVQHPDWEADDILATMANRLHEAGEEVVIVTGDDDLLMCVQDGKPGVMVFNPKTKQMFHEAQVVEKYGVGPKLLPELWAIQGDPSDNIPGVKGIGEEFSREAVKRSSGNLQRWLDSVVPSTPGEAKKVAALKADLDLIAKNYGLLCVNNHVSDMVFEEPVRNPELLEQKFREFGLGSFLKSFSEWSNFNG